MESLPPEIIFMIAKYLDGESDVITEYNGHTTGNGDQTNLVFVPPRLDFALVSRRIAAIVEPILYESFDFEYPSHFLPVRGELDPIEGPTKFHRLFNKHGVNIRYLSMELAPDYQRLPSGNTEFGLHSDRTRNGIRELLSNCPNVASLKLSSMPCKCLNFQVCDMLQVIANAIRSSSWLKTLHLIWTATEIRTLSQPLIPNPLPIIAKLNRLIVSFPIHDAAALNHILEVLGPAGESITECHLTFGHAYYTENILRSGYSMENPLVLPNLQKLTIDGAWHPEINRRSPLDILKFRPGIIRDLTLGLHGYIFINEYFEEVQESIAAQFPRVESLHVSLRAGGRPHEPRCGSENPPGIVYNLQPSIVEWHEGVFKELSRELRHLKEITLTGFAFWSDFSYHRQSYRAKWVPRRIYRIAHYAVERDQQNIKLRRV